jgi:predicted AAA+ superfamily ATPase
MTNPTNFLKLIADRHRNLKLIVSGSSTLEIRQKFKDSLAGRKVVFEVYPLDFYEFLIFKGEEKLGETILKNDIRHIDIKDPSQIDDFEIEFIGEKQPFPPEVKRFLEKGVRNYLRLLPLI